MSRRSYEEKRNYVTRLGLLLSVDRNTDVLRASYKREGDDEYE